MHEYDLALICMEIPGRSKFGHASLVRHILWYHAE